MIVVAPRLALTFGDFFGIGPELAARLLSDPDHSQTSWS